MSGKIIPISWFVATNVATVIFSKLQNRQQVIEGSHTKHFFHPFMHTWTMFLGMSFCLLPYVYSLRQNKPEQLIVDQQLSNKGPAKLYIYFILVILDLVSSTLSYSALNFLTGSSFTIIKGGIIIVTAIFSKFILKNILQKSHIAGCVLTLIGITIAGVGDTLDSPSDNQIDRLIIGILLLLAAITIQGLYFVVNEQAYQKYEITPLQMVAYEGVIGLILWTCIIAGLGFISCPFGPEVCTLNLGDEAFIERADIYFEELFSHTLILIFTILYVLSIAKFNLSLGQVIKVTSAFALVIIFISSNSLIWIVGIIITLFAGEDQQYELESISLLRNFIKLIGFLLTIIGTLIYHKILWKQLSKQQNRDKGKDGSHFALPNAEGSINLPNQSQ